MSDPSKFINTYIDTTVSVLHENLSSILQLKTQLKIANDIINEKEGVIGKLVQDMEQIKNNQRDPEEINQLNAEVSKLSSELLSKTKNFEQEYNAMKSKISHMDTLLNQVSEMKSIINLKNQTIEQLEKELTETKRLKNKTTKKKSTNGYIINTQNTNPTVEINDF